MIWRRSALAVLCVSALLGVESVRAWQAASTSADEANAKIWVGRHQEIEDYLRTAECVSTDTAPSGLPGSLRCTLRPGGPVARMYWRPTPPGLTRGFWMSYKAEVATYELDKILNLDMVPPTVEREFNGNRGSMVLWVEKLVAWKFPDPPPDSIKVDWDKQLARMTMFDNLIGNQVRNTGNMVRDAKWNLILLDHVATFRSGTELPSRMTRVDAALWTRVQALTRSQLDSRLGPWLDNDEITGILARREKMKAAIDALIADKGAAAVMLR